MARVARIVCVGFAASVALYLLLSVSLVPLVMYPPRPQYLPAEDQEVVADFTRRSCPAHLTAAESGEIITALILGFLLPRFSLLLLH